MDPEVDKLIQAIEILVGWRSNLKAGRSDPKIKERPLGVRHSTSLPTTTCSPSSVVSSAAAGQQPPSWRTGAVVAPSATSPSQMSSGVNRAGLP